VCGCVGVWVCGCVGVWVCGCVGVWVCGCVGVWVHARAFLVGVPQTAPALGWTVRPAQTWCVIYGSGHGPSCGVLAGGRGAVSPCFNCPLDVVKTRLMAQSVLPGTVPKYSGLLRSMGIIAKEEVRETSVPPARPWLQKSQRVGATAGVCACARVFFCSGCACVCGCWLVRAAYTTGPGCTVERAGAPAGQSCPRPGHHLDRREQSHKLVGNKPLVPLGRRRRAAAPTHSPPFQPVPKLETHPSPSPANSSLTPTFP
jgi:hypothetical protein